MSKKTNQTCSTDRVSESEGLHLAVSSILLKKSQIPVVMSNDVVFVKDFDITIIVTDFLHTPCHSFVWGHYNLQVVC